jgi:hypothetical protein
MMVVVVVVVVVVVIYRWVVCGGARFIFAAGVAVWS